MAKSGAVRGVLRFVDDDNKGDHAISARGSQARTPGPKYREDDAGVVSRHA
jgi:hypothetical protein